MLGSSQRARFATYGTILMGMLIGATLPRLTAQVAQAVAPPTSAPDVSPPRGMTLDDLYVGLILAGFAGAVTLLGYSLKSTSSLRENVGESFGKMALNLTSGLDRVEVNAEKSRHEMEDRMLRSIEALEGALRETDQRLGSDINKVNAIVSQHNVLFTGLMGEANGGLCGEVKDLRKGRQENAEALSRLEARLLRELEAVKQRRDS